MEDNRPRSQNQIDEGARTTSSLDDETEKKLLTGASACKWRKRTREFFREIVVLMRDTGMRNQRELYRMRIENLDWENRAIFVPDGKTAEGDDLFQ